MPLTARSPRDAAKGIPMPKGGARTRSGPPPDPNALSRDSSDWVVLPPAGRKGSAPAWPMPDQDAREAELWQQLWAKPQAVVWEQLGQEFEVALFTRRSVEAEQRESAVNLSTLVRQMADSLGLTSPGMRCNRWRIGEAETKGPRRASPVTTSARDRLRVVDSNGA